MSDAMQSATERLLAPGGLDERSVLATLSTIMGPGIDYADLYFQYTRQESWVMDEGVVKSGDFSIEQGVGVRANSGPKTGFAYSDEIELSALTQAGKVARAIAGSGSSERAIRVQGRNVGITPLYQPEDPISSLRDDEKVSLVKDVEEAARKMDPAITQVTVSLSGSHDVILIVSSDGSIATDIRPLVRMNVSVIAERAGRRERGSYGGGGRFGYEYFLENGRAMEYARDAVRQALVNLECKEAPAGEMTVVLGSGWPGILLHEAIGHGLEGDFNRKKTSAYSGRIGEKVASDLCTVVDDGTIADRRGSLSVDDEGIPTQNTVLIENGILKGYMQDRLNARLMKMQPTGNGRRESFSHLPMPRMTNTYMLSGKHDPEEILASVDKGVYAINFNGGQVDITSGQFVFSASEAYMIENGKKTYPIKGMTLIGNGPDVLTRVSMLGNDMALDTGVGVCGKDGQSVPVGVGQPTMRIDGLTVGGASV
ncbi:MAG: metalloprotease TldD [Gammaproteobacteria bacterium]|nr:metalloprotease TldD [Gammaproteobacteria bacterium]MCY4226549.1 metalloprotease TldD [Gammaproteobacteria bacterium]